MDNSFRFSSTYLFKIHTLKNALDNAFDQVLRKYAHTTLSQFTLFLAISENKNINQRQVAYLLEISPAAINRQVEIAQKQGLLHLENNPNRRGQTLVLTTEGMRAIDRGIQVVDAHLSALFIDENRQTNLMSHIDLLLNHVRKLSGKPDTPKRTSNHAHKIRKEKTMSTQIPKARKLYKGDINTTVIQVQKLTGVSIDPQWWDRNVGNNGTSESILDKFDKAYERDFSARIAELAARES
jgi:DNA-binding MarR family transcriptional regulator